MKQIIALHHISLPGGGTATPGEIIHSAFSPDQLSRLLRLGAIRVEGMDEETNPPAGGGETSTEGGHSDGLPPGTHIPSGSGETPLETPQDAPEPPRNDADEDDVDEDGEGDADGSEAITIDAASGHHRGQAPALATLGDCEQSPSLSGLWPASDGSVIETPQTTKQPTAPKRASVKKAAKKGGTEK